MSTGLQVRQIGPWGTAARASVGAGLVGLEIWLGIDLIDALVGLVVIPAAVLVVPGVLRRGDAPPLRAEGPAGHLLNFGVFFALVSLIPDAALLFYGGSMLLAAWRRFGACELFAVSNLLRHRDDRIGCPLFLPVDAAEAQLTGRQLYCS